MTARKSPATPTAIDAFDAPVIVVDESTHPAAHAQTIDEVAALPPEQRPVDGVFHETLQGAENGGRVVPPGKFEPVTTWTTETKHLGMQIKMRNRAKKIQFVNGQYTCRSEEELSLVKKALGKDIYYADGERTYGPTPGGYITKSSDAFNARCLIEVREA